MGLTLGVIQAVVDLQIGGATGNALKLQNTIKQTEQTFTSSVGGIATSASKMSQSIRAGFDAGTSAMGRFSSALKQLKPDSLREIGRTASIAGGGIVLAFGAAAKQAGDFDQALRNVDSIAHLSKGALADLHDSIKRLSDDPNVTQMPVKLAEGMYDVYSSGFAGAKALDILRVSALGASAGMTDTAVAAKALMAGMNSGVKGVASAQQEMDVLFQEVNDGVNTFEDLASEIGKVLPIAQAGGVSLQEIAAALAQMTKGGLSAGESVTDLTQYLQQMLKPSVDTVAIFRRLGIETGIVHLRNVGLAGSVLEVIEKTKGHDEALAHLFPNIQSFVGLLALAKNGGADFRAELDQMNHASDGLGATMEAARRQNEGFNNQLELLKKDASDAGIEIGDVLLPPLRDLIKDLKGAIDAFRSLSPETQRLWVDIGLGAGVLLFVGGRILDMGAKIAAFRTAVATARLAALAEAGGAGAAGAEAAGGAVLAAPAVGTIVAGLAVIAAAAYGANAAYHALGISSEDVTDEMDAESKKREEAARAAYEHAVKVKALCDALEEEKKKVDAGHGSLEKLRDIQNELSLLAPDLVSSYNKQHDAIIDMGRAYAWATDHARDFAAAGREGAKQRVAQAEADDKTRTQIARAKWNLQHNLMPQTDAGGNWVLRDNIPDTEWDEDKDNPYLPETASPNGAAFGFANYTLPKMVTLTPAQRAADEELIRNSEPDIEGRSKYGGLQQKALGETGSAIGKSIVQHMFDSIVTPENVASCALFVGEVFRRAGVKGFPAEDIANAGRLVQWVKDHGAKAHDWHDAHAGELIYFHGKGFGANGSQNHVALYAGDGMVVQSSTDSKTGVPVISKQSIPAMLAEKAHEGATATAFALPDALLGTGGGGGAGGGVTDFDAAADRRKAAITRQETKAATLEAQLANAMRLYERTGEQSYLSQAQAVISQMKDGRIRLAAQKRDDEALKEKTENANGAGSAAPKDESASRAAEYDKEVAEANLWAQNKLAEIADKSRLSPKQQRIMRSQIRQLDAQSQIDRLSAHIADTQRDIDLNGGSDLAYSNIESALRQRTGKADQLETEKYRQAAIENPLDEAVAKQTMVNALAKNQLDLQQGVADIEKQRRAFAAGRYREAQESLQTTVSELQTQRDLAATDEDRARIRREILDKQRMIAGFQLDADQLSENPFVRSHAEAAYRATMDSLAAQDTREAIDEQVSSHNRLAQLYRAQADAAANAAEKEGALRAAEAEDAAAALASGDAYAAATVALRNLNAERDRATAERLDFGSRAVAKGVTTGNFGQIETGLDTQTGAVIDALDAHPENLKSLLSTIAGLVKRGDLDPARALDRIVDVKSLATKKEAPQGGMSLDMLDEIRDAAAQVVADSVNEDLKAIKDAPPKLQAAALQAYLQRVESDPKVRGLGIETEATKPIIAALDQLSRARAAKTYVLDLGRSIREALGDSADYAVKKWRGFHDFIKSMGAGILSTLQDIAGKLLKAWIVGDKIDAGGEPMPNLAKLFRIRRPGSGNAGTDGSGAPSYYGVSGTDAAAGGWSIGQIAALGKSDGANGAATDAADAQSQAADAAKSAAGAQVKGASKSSAALIQGAGAIMEAGTFLQMAMSGQGKQKKAGMGGLLGIGLGLLAGSLLPHLSLLEGAEAGGMFGGLFGGMFADGGTVMPNKISLVGERGPELIGPPAAMRVLSNADSRLLAGGLSYRLPPIPAPRGGDAENRSFGRSETPQTLNININGDHHYQERVDPADVARHMAREIDDKRRMGVPVAG